MCDCLCVYANLLSCWWGDYFLDFLSLSLCCHSLIYRLLYHSTHQEQRTLANNKSNRNQNRFSLHVTLLALLLILCPVFLFFAHPPPLFSSRNNSRPTCKCALWWGYITSVTLVHSLSSHWFICAVYVCMCVWVWESVLREKKFMRRNNSFGAIILK